MFRFFFELLYTQSQWIAWCFPTSSGLAFSPIPLEYLYKKHQVLATAKGTTLKDSVKTVQDCSAGENILSTRTGLHVQIGIMTDQIHWDIILEQHVRLFWGIMGAKFLFMDNNARSQHANI